MSSSRLLDHPAALCNTVRRIAIEAGELTLDYYDESGCGDVETKDDGSPVTMADQAAEKLITAALRDLLPDVPVVGEEAVAAGHIPDLTGHDYFWLVDPLDGTKEFILGSGDFTVNIALIHRNEPLLGVVYAPVLEELYAGHGADTAIRCLADGDDKPLHVRLLPKRGLTVIASRHHNDPARLERFLEGQKVARTIHRGSSLKICAVAAGKADLYPRLGPTSAWDTAAGDAVLRGAGGGIIDFSGRALQYGPQAPFVNPEFIAASAEWLALGYPGS